MWVVMTSSANMPSSCRGQYRNVHAVELKSSWDLHASDGQAFVPHNGFGYSHTFPLFVPQRGFRAGIRSKEIASYRTFGPFNVGKTEKCAFAQALKRISERVTELNNASGPEEYDAAYTSLGGSA